MESVGKGIRMYNSMNFFFKYQYLCEQFFVLLKQLYIKISMILGSSVKIRNLWLLWVYIKTSEICKCYRTRITQFHYFQNLLKHDDNKSCQFFMLNKFCKNMALQKLVRSSSKYWLNRLQYTSSTYSVL